MSRLKQRTPEEIRLDAMKMGIKKAKNGCAECAEKYFELAQQHGATEQEIQHALEQALGVGKPGLNRRTLIKYAVAGAGGLAVASTALVTLERHNASSAAAATSYYYGIDSNTTKRVKT